MLAMNRRDFLKGLVGAAATLLLPLPLAKEKEAWHHVTIERDGNTTRVFLDGTEVNSLITGEDIRRAKRTLERNGCGPRGGHYYCYVHPDQYEELKGILSEYDDDDVIVLDARDRVTNQPINTKRKWGNKRTKGKVTSQYWRYGPVT